MRRQRSAVSSNLVAGLVVGTFVGLVLIGLYFSYVYNPAPSGTAVSFQTLNLFSGSPSTHSYSASCQGDAQLEFNAYNPSPNPVHVTKVVIWGSGLSGNATVLLSVSNSCLSLSEANPVIPPSGSYQFSGFINMPLAYLSNYNYYIQLDNGQNFTGILQAQT